MPSRSLLNAICLPFGDQIGNQSGVLPSVSCVIPVPSAFITTITELPQHVSGKRMYAIFLPFGDQTGSKS